jgi:hypothetical protein
MKKNGLRLPGTIGPPREPVRTIAEIPEPRLPLADHASLKIVANSVRFKYRERAFFRRMLSPPGQ